MFSYPYSFVDMVAYPESQGKEPTPQENLCVITFADDDQDFLEQSRVVPQDMPAERVCVSFSLQKYDAAHLAAPRYINSNGHGE